MMTDLFLHIANIGITAGWIVLSLLLLRLFLRKIPKWVTCLLWGVVGLRLLIPVSLTSQYSLQPSAEPIPADITTASVPQVQTGIPVVNNTVNPVLEETSNLPEILRILAIIWVVGVAVMFLYGLISYLLLRRKVAVSVKLEKRIYACDYVTSPFVLGLFFPRIYLPSDLDESCKGAVLAHEQAHIQRRDHWWKPLGFLLLAVYWFHPLLWVGYILLCRDIEAACDERVVRTMGIEERKSYSLALAKCSARKVRVMACPVAFGEVGVKGRIRAVLSYKKPAFWIIIASLVICVVVAVCFLTVPKSCKHDYISKITEAPTCAQEGVRTYTCKECEHRYKKPVKKLSHNYGAGTVITEPDCAQPGLAKHICIDCGYCAELEIGLNDAHQYEDKVTKEATCIEEGELTQTCKRCNHVQVTASPLTDHDYRVLVEFKGSCVDVGVRELICNVCEHQTREFTPKTGEHQYLNMGSYNQHYICVLCGAVP